MTLEPGEAVTLLRCPQAIPDRHWLLHNLLWGDTVSAIWPTAYDPTPRTREQNDSYRDTLEFRSADLFRPTFLDEVDLTDVVSGLNDVPDAVLNGEPTAWSEQNKELTAADPSDAESEAMTRKEAERFLYPGKLSPLVAQSLVTAGVLTEIAPTQDNQFGGYRATKPKLVPWLLVEAARQLGNNQQGVVPAPSSAPAVQGIAEPKTTSGNSVALSLTVPFVPDIRAGVTAKQIIDLRKNDKFDQSRKDYLDALCTVHKTITEVKLQAAATSDVNEVATAVRTTLMEHMLKDLELAQSSYFKRVSTKTLVGASADAGLAILAATAFESSGVVPAGVGFSLGAVGAIVQLVSTRRGTPSFVREASHIWEPGTLANVLA